MNIRTSAVSNAMLVHLASLLPKIEFNKEWRDGESGYCNITLESSELPEGEIHYSYDAGDERHLLVVRFQSELNVLYQSTDREMLLYAGNNDKLCEVMEITGPEITAYSLMLLFGFFGPETAVDYITGCFPPDDSAPSMSEVTDGASAPEAGAEAANAETASAATEEQQTQKQEEVDPELRKRIEGYVHIGVAFVAGVVVGALAMRKLG